MKRGAVKRSVWLAGAALALIGAWIVFAVVSRQREPVYEGKPISYWIRQAGIIDDTVVSDWGQLEHFPKIDSNAVPYILEALAGHSSRASRMYIRTWLMMPHAISRKLPNPVSKNLIRARLIQAVRNQPGAKEFAPQFVPALVRELRTAKSEYIRMLAAQSLGSLGRTNAEAEAALRQALSDEAIQVREEATNSLQKITQVETAQTSKPRFRAPH